MLARTWLIVPLTAALGLGAAVGFRGENQASASPPGEGPATNHRMVSGEASQTVRGDLAVRIPAELAVIDDRFDLLVHFHGVPQNQAENVDEAKLPAVVVSVNEGVASDAYAKAFAAPEALTRVVRLAEQEVAKRAPNAHVGRIALSAWSAGGAAVGKVLTQDADRIDAVIIADGLFSYWANESKTEVAKAPLKPFTDFARKAADDQKLFLLTHTAIPTDYPNVEACANTILDELAIPRTAAPAPKQPSGGNPTTAADRGSFHVRAFDGQGKAEHIEQLRALDDAYVGLRQRWER
jgi:hypothetical protein